MKEFKLAAVRRLEQGISIAEVARGRLQFGRPSAPRVIARLPLDSASSIHPVASAYVRSLPMREYRFHLSREKFSASGVETRYKFQLTPASAGNAF
jgi:hypothetical protein